MVIGLVVDNNFKQNNSPRSSNWNPGEIVCLGWWQPLNVGTGSLGGYSCFPSCRGSLGKKRSPAQKSDSESQSSQVFPSHSSCARCGLGFRDQRRPSFWCQLPQGTRSILCVLSQGSAFEAQLFCAFLRPLTLGVLDATRTCFPLW